MVRIGTARRSNRDDTDRDRRGRAPDAEHTAKIDEATERAAAAIRKAAASAAADRAHARARTSGLASISLVLGVVAALAVATGVLTGLGVAIGALALLAALGGLSATGRHYAFLSGRTEAIVGLLLAVAAIAVGVLGATGTVPGMDTDTNQVERLRELLPTWLT